MQNYVYSDIISCVDYLERLLIKMTHNVSIGPQTLLCPWVQNRWYSL